MIKREADNYFRAPFTDLHSDAIATAGNSLVVAKYFHVDSGEDAKRTEQKLEKELISLFVCYVCLFMCLCMLDYLFVRFFVVFFPLLPPFCANPRYLNAMGSLMLKFPSNSEENKGVLFTKGNTSVEIQR